MYHELFKKSMDEEYRKNVIEMKIWQNCLCYNNYIANNVDHLQLFSIEYDETTGKYVSFVITNGFYMIFTAIYVHVYLHRLKV